MTCDHKQDILVRNRLPTATFTAVPGAPVVREQLVFSSTAADPDGPIVKQEWDLDGDGAFDDATGETALHVFGRAGTHPVALRVTDRDGAQVIGRASIIVSPRPLGALNPAPLVRVVGVPTSRGSQLSLISVLAPKGAHVGVRCKGGACPYKHKRFTSKGKRVILRALSGSYVEGNVIEIRVTRFETMGKITRLRVRAGKRPARLDRCIVPGRPNKPVRCRPAESDSGRGSAAEELVQAGARALAHRALDDRRPAQQQSRRAERLARPAWKPNESSCSAIRPSANRKRARTSL